jgi:hypothetical protein
MNKEEFISRYGEEGYEKMLEQTRVWQKEHPEELKVRSQKQCRKDGKYYDKKVEYMRTGLQGERQRIRMKHGNQYRTFKMIIAPDSEIHHEWIPQTAEYRGLALVEANPHQYGIIDVIVILDGTITLLTEKDIREAC